MKSGIGFPSYGRDATWSLGPGSNAMAADFPMQNLANLEELRRVALQAAPGGQNLYFDLGAVREIDFLALIHHNAPAAAIFTVTLYDGANQTGAVVYASGNQAFWPGGAVNRDYPAVRPLRLPAPVNARSGLIALTANTVPWEIGGVEIASFWEWNDVAVPREIGVRSNASSAAMGGGVTHVTRQWAPRTVAGSREAVDLPELETRLLDHQRINGLHRTFVWCWDVDDPATWARQAMAVTNSELPAGVRDAYQSGRINFAFREQLR